MDEKRSGPGDVPTGERVRDIGSAIMSSVGQKVSGTQDHREPGAQSCLSESEVEALTRDWPKAPRNVLKQMLRQYSLPNEGTAYRLIWYYNGPWKRTELTRDEIAHNFPAPHTDYLTNWIDYRVPPEAAAALTIYDGSCLIDRTAGEAGARCDSEAANFITINFMHEIVTGTKSVEEAREAYASQMAAYMMGRPATYAEKLLFDAPSGGTMDPDEAVLAPQVEQMKEKAKDLFFGKNRSDEGSR
jgi:hypothetical protein